MKKKRVKEFEHKKIIIKANTIMEKYADHMQKMPEGINLRLAIDNFT